MTHTRKAPRVQARTAGQAARETRGDDADSTTPSGAELRALRERRGLTQGAAARHLAASTGLSATAWQVALSEYERGRRRPEAERLAALLALYSPEPDDACRQDVAEALRDVPRLVEAHGADRVSMALQEYAAMVIHRSADDPRQSKLADGGTCPHDANYQWSTITGPCRGRLHAVGDGTYRCDRCRVTWTHTQNKNRPHPEG